MAIKKDIRLAREGDQQAFRRLLKAYWDDVFRFQRSLIDNEAEAEDITIETFARAFEKLHLYDEKYPFKNWLLSISRNLYRDRRHRKTREKNMAPLDQHPQVLKMAENPDDDDNEILEAKLSELKKALSELKPAYRQVLEWYYFHDLSYKEIAGRAGISLSNVKIRILRAKALLAKKLKKA